MLSTLLALFVTAFAHQAQAQELTFNSMINSDHVELLHAETSERDQYLAWAKSYAHYRKYPKGIESQDFLANCLRDSTSNLFCPLTVPKPDSKSLVTPKSLREKYYNAILRLDKVATRPLTCKASLKDLKAVIDDANGQRLEARSLYWMWLCSGILKNDKATQEYKERLWRRFPLDHHTFMVLSAEHDARISERLHDQTDLALATRSNTVPTLNAWIKGIEALILLNEYGSATVVTNALDQDLRKLEPEVRLYIAALMARASRRIPSALPVARVLVPLIATVPNDLNQAVAQALFPNDYPLFDSELGHEVQGHEIVDKYRDHVGPNLLSGLIYYESAWNPRASSGANAFGLLQLLLSTATDEYRIESGDKTAVVTRDQLYDPRFSLKLGTGYLERLKNSTKSWSLALASYNAGPTKVSDWIKAAPKMTDPQVQIDLLLMKEDQELHASDYVSTVLGKANWYSAIYSN